jgi:hypothetical protein
MNGKANFQVCHDHFIFENPNLKLVALFEVFIGNTIVLRIVNKIYTFNFSSHCRHFVDTSTMHFRFFFIRDLGGIHVHGDTIFRPVPERHFLPLAVSNKPNRLVFIVFHVY